MSEKLFRAFIKIAAIIMAVTILAIAAYYALIFFTVKLSIETAKLPTDRSRMQPIEGLKSSSCRMDMKPLGNASHNAEPAQFTTAGGTLNIKLTQFNRDLKDSVAVYIGADTNPPVWNEKSKTVDNAAIKFQAKQDDYYAIDLEPGRYWFWTSDAANAFIGSCSDNGLRDVLRGHQPCGGNPATTFDLGSPTSEGPMAEFVTLGGEIYFTSDGYDHSGILSDLFGTRGVTGIKVGFSSTPPIYDPQRGTMTNVVESFYINEDDYGVLNLAPGRYWLSSGGSPVSISTCDPEVVEITHPARIYPSCSGRTPNSGMAFDILDKNSQSGEFITNGDPFYVLLNSIDNRDPVANKKEVAVYIGTASNPPVYDENSDSFSSATQKVYLFDGEYGEFTLPAGQYWLRSDSGKKVTIKSCAYQAVANPNLAKLPSPCGDQAPAALLELGTPVMNADFASFLAEDGIVYVAARDFIQNSSLPEISSHDIYFSPFDFSKNNPPDGISEATNTVKVEAGKYYPVKLSRGRYWIWTGGGKDIAVASCEPNGVSYPIPAIPE